MQFRISKLGPVPALFIVIPFLSRLFMFLYSSNISRDTFSVDEPEKKPDRAGHLSGWLYCGITGVCLPTSRHNQSVWAVPGNDRGSGAGNRRHPIPLIRPVGRGRRASGRSHNRCYYVLRQCNLRLPMTICPAINRITCRNPLPFQHSEGIT